MAISLCRQTTDAAATLGALIAAGRRERRWTAAELAERVGVSAPTLRKVERGDPSVALGTYFEAAVLVGVPLFSADREQQAALSDVAALRLAVLPARVRRSADDISDDF